MVCRVDAVWRNNKPAKYETAPADIHHARICDHKDQSRLMILDHLKRDGD